MPNFLLLQHEQLTTAITSAQLPLQVSMPLSYHYILDGCEVLVPLALEMALSYQILER